MSLSDILRLTLPTDREQLLELLKSVNEREGSPAEGLEDAEGITKHLLALAKGSTADTELCKEVLHTIQMLLDDSPAAKAFKNPETASVLREVYEEAAKNLELREDAVLIVQALAGINAVKDTIGPIFVPLFCDMVGATEGTHIQRFMLGTMNLALSSAATKDSINEEHPKKLIALLQTTGDGHLQKQITEVLIRMRRKFNGIAEMISSDPEVSVAFDNIKGTSDFQNLLQIFLNVFNQSLKENQKVFSFHADAILIEGRHTQGPTWVDFGPTAASVMLVHPGAEKEPWELIYADVRHMKIGKTGTQPRLMAKLRIIPPALEEILDPNEWIMFAFPAATIEEFKVKALPAIAAEQKKFKEARESQLQQNEEPAARATPAKKPAEQNGEGDGEAGDSPVRRHNTRLSQQQQPSSAAGLRSPSQRQQAPTATATATKPTLKGSGGGASRALPPSASSSSANAAPPAEDGRKKAANGVTAAPNARRSATVVSPGGTLSGLGQRATNGARGNKRPLDAAEDASPRVSRRRLLNVAEGPSSSSSAAAKKQSGRKDSGADGELFEPYMSPAKDDGEDNDESGGFLREAVGARAATTTKRAGAGNPTTSRSTSSKRRSGADPMDEDDEGHTGLFGKKSGDADVFRLNFDSSQASQVSTPAGDDDEKGLSDVVKQLQTLIGKKTEQKRKKGEALINDAMKQIQKKVEQFKAESQKRRQQFVTDMQEKLQSVQEEMKETRGTFQTSYNNFAKQWSELESEMKKLNGMVKTANEKVQTTLPALMKETEEKALLSLKTQVETTVNELGKALDQVVSSKTTMQRVGKLLLDQLGDE